VFGLVEPWHILAFSFMSAAVLAFDNPARQALLPDLVGADDLMNAISLNSWSFNGATLVGPALAAALLPVIGIGGVFYLNAISFAAVLLALMMLRIKGGVVAVGSARQNLVEGLRFLQQSPLLLALVLMTAVVSLLGRSYGQLMPVFARDLLGLDVSGMSVLYTMAGLGSCVGAMVLIALRNPVYKGRLALGAGFGFTVALGLFALSRSIWWSAVLVFVIGLALIAFSTAVSTLLQTQTPGELRGRVMSVNTLAWQGLEYAGVLITGTLATVWGASTILLGAAGVIAAVLLAVGLRRSEIVQLK
jgi:predicted MFS family arabinose efflux permease